MLLKCNYCDPKISKEMKANGIKPIKTINTSSDQYIKDEKGKYYHVECYVQHLIKKKYTEEEARKKLEERMEITKNEIQETLDRDEFFQWIKNYYDSSLPSYFCMKVSEIVKGTHDQVNEPISYVTLLDIYRTMAVYLHKNAMKKNFKKTGQRMNYDLAVVIGNYGDYKKYKERERQSNLSKIDIESKIHESKNYSNIIKKVNKKDKNDEFDLLDVMDELLL
ncbi:hypothetical protein [Heyndrickxia camelliae]|uniref:PARP-type domain-containing protein n=1 Tax=Heyndrickxia camelliae TaxID=1707093 RepID=A0A2N3LG79_9BACI|nr:hypothetical protein [Heyndrickxia camelliae]PKR83523.1 hypothetical protein CWO92_18330 [Heyndrickxia camelliae]